LKPWTRIEQYFKHKQLRALEGILGLPEISPRDVDWNRIKRILVVRQHDQLGDFLLSTPVFGAIKKHAPTVEITLVARSYTASLARHHRYIDDIMVVYEQGRYWTGASLSRFIKQLGRGYDLVVVLNTVSHSLTSDLVARFSRARYILGSSHRLFSGTSRNFFYNLNAPFLSEPGRHQSERNLDIIRYLGIECDSSREAIFLTEDEKQWAKNQLSALGIDNKKKVVVVHPGAGKIGNRWPVDRFARVASRLADECGAQVIVISGANENELTSQFLQLMPSQAFGWNSAYLRQVAAMISQTDLLLCNDTGIMHVCAAVGTPFVAVFGPTDPLEWKPVGEEFIAIRGKDLTCLSVAENAVFEAAMSLLHK
jgi:ADP-heptose:LPS heptosyltransferase